MKKKMVMAAAAAVACGGAGAQSVTLSGLVDAYAGSMQASGGKRVAAVNSGGMSTSWWGMEGKEELGGGLKAEFKLGGYFRGDTGAPGRFDGNETFFSRNAFVGLSGGFGTIHLGRDGAPNFLPTALFNAFGDSFAFSPIILHADVPLYNRSGWQSANAADTGWSNQIRYTTPSFGGLTANLHYQFGEAPGDNGKRNAGASFLYFNGRFGLGGFVHRVRTDNPLAGTLGDVKLGFSQQDAWMLSGKAGFGPVNLYANYEQTKNGNYAGDPGIAGSAGNAGNAKSKTWSLSADYELGQGKLLAAFANTRWTGSASVALAGSKRDTLSLGYDHNLSRRTDLYAVLMSDKITGFNRGNSFAVGMRHRF